MGNSESGACSPLCRESERLENTWSIPQVNFEQTNVGLNIIPEAVGKCLVRLTRRNKRYLFGRLMGHTGVKIGYFDIMIF